MRKTVSPNDRFENLLVIDMLEEFYVEPNGKMRRKALVQCDCGEQFKIVATYLFRAGQKCATCRFNKNCIVQIGQVYDQLTLIAFTKDTRNRKMAVCKCVCGNVVDRRPELLKTINITNNCGCQHRGRWKGIGDLSLTTMCRIKRNAQVRDLQFEVSIEYLWQLYQQQDAKCALTGLQIDFGEKTTDPNDASLDRIDSNQGYVDGNLQWVHKDIQKMKMDLPQDRFIELCKLVSQKN
jgi:hypothetical protein